MRSDSSVTDPDVNMYRLLTAAVVPRPKRPEDIRW